MHSAKMCKFTSRLFVFLLIGLYHGSILSSATLAGRSPEAVGPLLQLFTDYHDRDQHYDQRQWGKHNVLVKFDNFVLRLPEIAEQSNPTVDSADAEEEALIAGSGANGFYKLDWVISGLTTEAADNLEVNTVTNELQSRTDVVAAAEIESDKDNIIISVVDAIRDRVAIESRYASEESPVEMDIDALTRAKWSFLYFFDSLKHRRQYEE